MYEYEHTQPGTLIRCMLGGGALIAGGIAVLMPSREPVVMSIPAAAAWILVAGLFLFHSLTVNVSRDDIILRFGIGLIRKRFAFTNIQSAVIVRNRWWYGWGIKLTPHGWLYNVSGLDAVEIQLKNGRKYRIGADEPVKLLSAIESAVKTSR